MLRRVGPSSLLQTLLGLPWPTSWLLHCEENKARKLPRRTRTPGTSHLLRHPLTAKVLLLPGVPFRLDPRLRTWETLWENLLLRHSHHSHQFHPLVAQWVVGDSLETKRAAILGLLSLVHQLEGKLRLVLQHGQKRVETLVEDCLAMVRTMIF